MLDERSPPRRKQGQFPPQWLSHAGAHRGSQHPFDETGEVRHLQPSDTVIGERDFSARYELAGSGRRSGNYLITVTYP